MTNLWYIEAHATYTIAEAIYEFLKQLRSNIYIALSLLKATPEKFVHVLDNINRFSSSGETSIKHQFTRVAQNLHDDLSSFCAACACTGFCYDVQQKTRTEYVHITFCTAIFLSL